MRGGLNTNGYSETAPVAYVVVEVGDRDQYPYVCENPPKDNGLLFCGNGLALILVVNTKRLRMQRYHANGYVFSFGQEDSEQSDTPFIEIGRCASF